MKLSGDKEEFDGISDDEMAHRYFHYSLESLKKNSFFSSHQRRIISLLNSAQLYWAFYTRIYCTNYRKNCQLMGSLFGYSLATCVNTGCFLLFTTVFFQNDVLLQYQQLLHCSMVVIDCMLGICKLTQLLCQKVK